MAGIKDTQRVAAWNVEFVDNTDQSFAGLFQAKEMITCQDTFDELRLCFILGQHDDLALWNMAPEVSDRIDDVCIHATGSVDTLNRPLRLRYLGESGQKPSKTRYRVVNHDIDKCDRQDSVHLGDHIAGTCATQIPRPVRRQHPSYRPINKTSDDPDLPSTPKRGSRRGSPTKTSGSQSPVKRVKTNSGASPQPPQDSGQLQEDAIESFINKQDAKKAMDSFRNAAETRGSSCAISGMGGGWANGMVVGPGIHACHIVPQSTWDQYPLPEDEDEDDYGPTLDSQRKWQRKWESTWAGENALWMQSSIHDAHDGRILAIHPETWKIRVFAPYDLIIPYQNTTAHLSEDYPPDARALRYQWESCVIENMTAKNLWRNPIRTFASPPEPESSVIEGEWRSSPTKQHRALKMSSTSQTLGLTTLDLQAATGEALDDCRHASPSDQSVPELEMLTSDTTPRLDESSESIKDPDSNWTKKRRLSSDVKHLVDIDLDYITSVNAASFLADVNWELKRQKRG
ncbi:hypothetical protein BDZ45DRAFT_677476 [Acephala macrosclerotiorum]|nr:hypothetical protein BDZ45DRAFT_677476 [Acephala macrosclerotiorum]